MDKYTLNILDQSHRGERSGRNDKEIIIHATDLINFCPRDFAICFKKKIPYHDNRYLNIGTSLTYNIGHKIQDIITSRFRKTKLLVTSWECRHCGHIFFNLPTKNCVSCNSSALKAIDTRLSFPLSKGVIVSGGVDSFLLYIKDTAFSVEVKSIQRKDFEALQRPVSDHVKQLKIYLWLLKKGVKIKNNLIDSIKLNNSKGVVLYVAKEYQKMPYKAFEISSDKLTNDLLDNDIKQVKSFLKTGKLPKKICKDGYSSMARKCGRSVSCLGNKNGTK